MFTVLHNTDNNGITMINENHPDYHIYAENKEELCRDTERECTNVVEQFFEDNSIPEELRLFQIVRIND
jgi:hypothetical protein